ncbi:NPCBM/NEW2 domain-containing protein [Haliscomenobacter sp.]|uniref:NPCBM/NEW2 domain-containing protein n=1 Tax=Haliscomenobacter sp. TaxID=2717303 RepID=UPI003BAD807E
MHTRNFNLLFCLLGLVISCQVFAQSSTTVWLDDLPIQTFSEGLRPVEAKASYAKDTIRIQAQRFLRGIGGQSPMILAFYLNKKAARFTALIGPDDSGNQDIPLSFYVVADHKVLFEKLDMKHGDAPVSVDVDLRGVERFGLLVTDRIGGSNNKRTYANWANAKLEMLDGSKPGYIPNEDEKYILTPAPGKKPRINSAKIFGAKSGNPVLYTIAATGERPLLFSATPLPKGLKLDAKTGIISGRVAQRGTYELALSAKNKYGKTQQKLLLKIGDTIALTPPIGWNGWNSWARNIDQGKVIASAEAMVSKGLRDHGWTYINIDDAWQGIRSGPDTALQANEKFPDIKGMMDRIHALGLKVGLYSTPYIASYAGFIGASSDYPAGGETQKLFVPSRQPYSRIAKYRFERNDARQMAAWGTDFLKYDWRIDVVSAERMSEALKKSGRDIVFSISNNAPFDKVKDWNRVTNMYRTGPDIKDSWTSLYHTSFTLDRWAPYSGPGHWLDPDMMILGEVSIGPMMHPTRLTPDEQYSHVSIFSLLAAPMLIGCPIEQLDAFTLNLLSNDEVIAINQDPLGKAARLVLEEDDVQVWLKPLEDGSFAVGLFNIAGYGKTPESYFRWGDEPQKVFTLHFDKIGLKGRYLIRDVWRQKDVAEYTGSFQADIPYHGVMLHKFTPIK